MIHCNLKFSEHSMGKFQDSPMVAVDLTSAFPHQTSDPALTGLQPRNDTQASTLASLGGIRVIISSLRTPTERAVPPPPSYDEALDPNGKHS